MLESWTKKKKKPPYKVKRGETVYMDISKPFEKPLSVSVLFLEWIYCDDGYETEGDETEEPNFAYYGRIINHNGRIQNVHSSVLKRHKT